MSCSGQSGLKSIYPGPSFFLVDLSTTLGLSLSLPLLSLSHPRILTQYGHVRPMNRWLCLRHEWTDATEGE